MTFTPPGSAPDYYPLPARPWWGVASGTATQVIADFSTPANVQYYLEGVNLLQPLYDNGNNCNVFFNGTLIPGGAATFFQAFVYTSDQAFRQWTGRIPCPLGSRLEMDPVVGTWVAWAWGTILPVLGN